MFTVLVILQSLLVSCGSPRDSSSTSVFIIGDSISLGYGDQLKQVATDFVITRATTALGVRENCGSTERTRVNIDRWLSQAGSVDVILWNNGLHDIRFPALGAPNAVSITAYETNLRKIGSRLKKTKAKIYFLTTTPVPAGEEHRISSDVDDYNAVAISVMEDLGIEVVDFNGMAGERPDLQIPNNVHYTPAGYSYLAQRLLTEVLQ